MILDSGNLRIICFAVTFEITKMDGQNVRNKSASFRIEISGDNEKKAKFLAKMQCFRNYLLKQFNKPVNNSDILNVALDFWNQMHFEATEDHAKASYTESSKAVCKQNVSNAF